ncbi:hypothetical protein GARC_4797 [Paraglaciecola arctica BSs20135]|uniref:DUF2914 domain-containing protein n=2 Tax=Paraglaciecola TaxID=1621534 RepID=K6XM48_9ALTE|nr:hypothetical protein GARC_4797 [Paraglaciecola arctica BSs20135]
MTKLTLLLIILSLGVFSQFVTAQVTRSQLTSSIESREPTDNLEGLVQGQYDEMKRVYFFTQVAGLTNQQIIHRWLYEGDEKAVVALNIGGDNWRTYSSKSVPSYWQGKWQVQVWQGDLMLISHHFEVSYSE